MIFILRTYLNRRKFQDRTCHFFRTTFPDHGLRIVVFLIKGTRLRTGHVHKTFSQRFYQPVHGTTANKVSILVWCYCGFTWQILIKIFKKTTRETILILELNYKLFGNVQINGRDSLYLPHKTCNVINEYCIWCKHLN